MDRPYPVLTCEGCGETKSALHFPKRYGDYRKYKLYDERRYDNQCKRCRKPAKPGQSRDEVVAPKIRHKSQAGKVSAIKKKKRVRAAKRGEKLTPNEYKQKIRRETRIKSMQYLAGKGCAICGERDPRCLEYDHREPVDKKRGISRLIIDGFGWSSRTLRREIRKCRILCASCHRKHTIEQQGYYAHEEVQRTLGELAARYKFDI
jgi:hypothetical protein